MVLPAAGKLDSNNTRLTAGGDIPYNESTSQVGVGWGIVRPRRNG